jgi:hypothetical protein
VEKEIGKTKSTKSVEEIEKKSQETVVV